MHRNKKRLYRIFAIFLAFLLAVGHLQMPGKAIRIEPEDPITTEPEVLLTEDYSDQVDQGYLLLAEKLPQTGISQISAPAVSPVLRLPSNSRHLPV